MKNIDYEIYTDGGYSLQHNKGGFAFIILKGEDIWKKESFPIEHETNNRGELKAILYAIESLPPRCSCIVYSDSQYAIGVLSNKNWHPKANTDIIDEYHQVVNDSDIEVKFKWVKGHSGNKWNEECDRMCDEVAGMDLNAEFRNKKKKKSKYSRYSDTELLNMLKEINKELKARNIL